MTAFIQAVYAPMILIFGLSHLAQPRLWSDFFQVLARTGVAPLIIGMYTLPTGLLLIVGHNLWVMDWPLIITLSGWGMTVKSVIYLLAPRLPSKMIERATRPEISAWKFRVAGAVMAVFGVILTWQALRHVSA